MKWAFSFVESVSKFFTNIELWVVLFFCTFGVVFVPTKRVLSFCGMSRWFDFTEKVKENPIQRHEEIEEKIWICFLLFLALCTGFKGRGKEGGRKSPWGKWLVAKGYILCAHEKCLIRCVVEQRFAQFGVLLKAVSKPFALAISVSACIASNAPRSFCFSRLNLMQLFFIFIIHMPSQKNVKWR